MSASAVRPERIVPPEWLASNANPTVLYRWLAVGGKLTRWHVMRGVNRTDYMGCVVMIQGERDGFTGGMVAVCGVHVPMSAPPGADLLPREGELRVGTRAAPIDGLRDDVKFLEMAPEYEWPHAVMDEVCSSCLYVIASPAGKRMGWGGRRAT